MCHKDTSAAHAAGALTVCIGAVSPKQETVLEVEYTFAVAPPQQQAQRPHDDWCAPLGSSGDELAPAEHACVLACGWAP